MVQPSGDENAPGPPELEEFNKLLISEKFNTDTYTSRALAVCGAWLEAREYDVYLWVRSFRLNRSDLHGALTEIQKNLKSLFTMLDRLGGRRSYLAASPFNIPAEVENLFKEYLRVNDGIWDLLEEYLMYANSYKERYDKREQLDKALLGRSSTEMREDLFERLDHLQEVLAALAVSLAGLSPGSGPAQRSSA